MATRKTAAAKAATATAPATTNDPDEIASIVQAIEQAAATGRPLAVENPTGTITHYAVTVTDDPGN